MSRAGASEGRPNRRTAPPCAHWDVPPPLWWCWGFRAAKPPSTRWDEQTSVGKPPFGRQGRCHCLLVIELIFLYCVKPFGDSH